MSSSAQAQERLKRRSNTGASYSAHVLSTSGLMPSVHADFPWCSLLSSVSTWTEVTVRPTKGGDGGKGEGTGGRRRRGERGGELHYGVDMMTDIKPIKKQVEFIGFNSVTLHRSGELLVAGHGLESFPHLTHIILCQALLYLPPVCVLFPTDPLFQLCLCQP